MRALVQRVSRAAVRVDGETIGAIGPGLLVLLGVTHDDDEAACDKLADKVRALRIFGDDDGRMNVALEGREVLVISQFTLYGDARKGNRPVLRRGAHGRSRPSRSTSASARAWTPPAASSARTWRSSSSTTGR